VLKGVRVAKPMRLIDDESLKGSMTCSAPRRHWLGAAAMRGLRCIFAGRATIRTGWIPIRDFSNNQCGPPDDLVLLYQPVCCLRFLQRKGPGDHRFYFLLVNKLDRILQLRHRDIP
jgi:hypothetical protein